MAEVLVIDDDEFICEMLSDMVEDMGHAVFAATTLSEGFRLASSKSPDVVFLDVRMPDGNGLDLLPRIRKLPSNPEVIIITGMGDPDGAELAIKNGAWDYIQKSTSRKEIVLTCTRALEYRKERTAAKPPVALRLNGIIGNSDKMKACLDLLAQAAGSNANTLITGETGTGKELFARAIHDNSVRAQKSFVVVDCTVLPENLVESVLFGFEKGSFTGADRTREGLIKQADRGTLFLDEVGELPLSMQKAFLRVLQERRFRPVGAKEEEASDFRLVAATNRDLEAMVREGRFREDLLFRLKGITVELPPLRERVSDLKDLFITHMTRLCERYAIATKGFSPDFFEVLGRYSWPGNVRELVSTVERMLAQAPQVHILYPRHLPTDIRATIARESIPRGPVPTVYQAKKGGDVVPLTSIDDYRNQMEKRYLVDLASNTKGSVREMMRISGLSRSHLYALFKKHSLTLK